MIRQDEMAPTRSRRRSFYYSFYGADTTAKLGYPVGKWSRRYVMVNGTDDARILASGAMGQGNISCRKSDHGGVFNACYY